MKNKGPFVTLDNNKKYVLLFKKDENILFEWTGESIVSCKHIKNNEILKLSFIYREELQKWIEYYTKKEYKIVKINL